MLYSWNPGILHHTDTFVILGDCRYLSRFTSVYANLFYCLNLEKTTAFLRPKTINTHSLLRYNVMI